MAVITRHLKSDVIQKARDAARTHRVARYPLWADQETLPLSHLSELPLPG
jgi:hypothetical protein